MKVQQVKTEWGVSEEGERERDREKESRELTE